VGRENGEAGFRDKAVELLAAGHGREFDILQSQFGGLRF